MPQNLNSSQDAAVRAPHQAPLLIVAGAGTGKTRTLTNRLIYLIEQGVSPERICALTFTNKAAKEMRERIAHLLPSGQTASGGPFIGTFHSFGARVLRSEARHFGRTPNFVIYDNGDSFHLLKKIIKEFSAEEKIADTPTHIANVITAIKNGMRDTTELEASPRPGDRHIIDIFARYERELAKNNAFDFDDLIEKVVALWNANPDIRARYEKKYPCVLVDEYQDLNNTQYELVKLLAGKSQMLSVVGDDQQTIYSWRGSNFEIFLNFERDWPHSTVVVLDQNYRSSGTIISAASALVAHNTKQKPKTLWTENDPGAPIELIEAGDEASEAQWIADHIIGTPGTDAAILYRTNAQSRAIEQALIERGVPYEIYGGLKFYERREIKDILAALRYISNPHDSVSFDRLEKTFMKRRMRLLAPGLLAQQGKLPADAIGFFLHETDYFALVERTMTNPADRRENIAELLRFAGGFSTLESFLEEVTLLQATDTVHTSPRTPVKLMTIHLAKGLEFDAVYIAGCTEGILPHARSIGSMSELEEERRLLYVGMTRARKNLFLSFYDLPSRFISEIPGEYIQFTNLISETDGFVDNEERYITFD